MANRESGDRRFGAAFLGALIVTACWSGLLVAGESLSADSRAQTKFRVEKAVADLSSPDWKVRQAAVKDLGALAPFTEAAIPALLGRLSDTDPPIPKNDGYFLDPGPTIGELSARALAAIGPAAESALREGLRGGTLHAQCCAAIGLARLKTSDAREHLSQRLPSTWGVPQITPHKSAPRAGMITALGELKDPRAIPVLMQAMERDGLESNRCLAVRAVGTIGGEAAQRALRRAYEPTYVSGVRVVAIRTLVDLLGAKAEPDVRKLRQDKDRRLQSVAAGLLPKVVDVDDVGSLRRTLGSGQVIDRRSAAASLANLKSPAAVPELLRALSDPDDKVRKTASTALRHGSHPTAVPGLVEFVQRNPDNPIRQSALTTIATTPGPEAVAGLCLLLLTHPEGQVRQRVVHCLDHKPSDDMIQAALKRAMNRDTDEKVRAKAKEIVSRREALTLPTQREAATGTQTRKKIREKPRSEAD